MIFFIGQKFPSKSLEVLLKASLQFGDYSPDTTSQKDDVFCTGSNTYAQVYFWLLLNFNIYDLNLPGAIPL